MAKKLIPVLDPNRFVREFIQPPAIANTVYPVVGGQSGMHNFFAITRIEDYVQHIRFPIPVSRNFHYDFFLITKGHLLLTDGLQTYRVSENTVVLRAAGSITGAEECSSDARGFYGLFDAEYVLYNLKNQNSLNELPFFGPDALPAVHLSAETTEDFRRQLTKIEAAHLSHQPGEQGYISSLLYSFLLDAALAHGKPMTTASPSLSAGDLTTRFKNLLRQYILTKRAVHDYADLLNVTPNHLNRSIKDATGKTVSNWITDALMLEAKVLLRQTNLSIAEIAFELGIDDVSYFARLFKKHSGQPPSTYREA
jgi:AraC-like DNA-binding protein